MFKNTESNVYALIHRLAAYLCAGEVSIRDYWPSSYLNSPSSLFYDSSFL